MTSISHGVAVRRLAALGVAALCAFAVAGRPPAATASPRPVALWISPRGNDHSDGSRAHPFRTLARARDAERALGIAGRRAGVHVYLLGGVYRLTHTLVLDWRDSGSATGSVVWSAAPGAHPVISGAIRVGRWTLHDAARGIYEARVPANLSTRELYVDGRRAVRARGATDPAGFARTPTGFRAPNDAMDSWRNPRGVEVVTLTQWKAMRCPVQAIRGRDVIVQQPCWSNVNVFPYQWSFQTLSWLENAYALLDKPGEWYLDAPARRLYYIPLRGQRMSRVDVEAPDLQALVDVRGTPRRPVEHLRFQGLRFEYGSWLGPSGPNGYADDQSGFHLDGSGHRPNATGHDPDTTRTPGNVRLSYARDVAFVHDDFVHLGGAGLDFASGSQHDAIIANRFRDISAAAVQLGGVSALDAHPRSPSQVTRDNVISNNVISAIGREYEDAAGIFVGFTTRTLVAHNDLTDVPWSGIAIGWGWGLLDPGGYLGVPGAVQGQWGNYTTATTSSGNRIVDNRVRGFLEALWDGGAVYTLGQQGASARAGELIAGNVASDKRPSAGGNTFYTDGGSRYVTLERNVSLDNPPGVTDLGPCGLPDSLPLCSVRIPYGSDRGGCRPYGDITYLDNYFGHPAPFFGICPYPPHPVNVVDVGTHVISTAAQVPRSILAAAGLQGAYRSTVGAGG